MNSKPKRRRKPSHATLARRLGYSANAVRHWARRPDAPRGLDLEEWRGWILERGLGIAGNRVSARRESLLISRLEEEVAAARSRRRKDDGSLTDSAEVSAMLYHLAVRTRATLYSSMISELPGKLAGRSAGEIRGVLSDAADVICDQIRAVHSEFSDAHEKQCARVDSLAVAALARVADPDLAAKVVRVLRHQNLLANYENSIPENEAAPASPEIAGHLPGNSERH